MHRLVAAFVVVASVLVATPASATPVDHLHATATGVNDFDTGIPCQAIAVGTVVPARGPAFTLHQEVCSVLVGNVYRATGVFTLSRPGGTLTGTSTSECFPLQCLNGTPPLTVDLVITGGTARYRDASGSLTATTTSHLIGPGLQEFESTIDGTIVRH